MPIRMRGGYWTWLWGRGDMTKLAASTIRLSKACQKQGCGFLFVQAPLKIAPDEPGISGIFDFSGQNADAFLEELRKNRVAVMDLRKNIRAEGLNHHALFFKTDHHWKPETGLWATKRIAERLNRDFGFRIDTSLFDKERFQIDVYPSWFLGSLGKRATLARTDPEDISLIYPKYDTDMRFMIPSIDIDRHGGFQILLDMPRIAKKNYYGNNPYAVYCYGDKPLSVIFNDAETTDHKKVLFIRDSFACVIAPFLALGIKEIDIIDLRHFPASLESYIEKTHPDMVIALYSDYGGLINWDIPPHLR